MRPFLWLATTFLVVLFAAPGSAGEERPSVENLAERLTSPEVADRRQAAWDLWLRRDEAAPVAAALATAIRDGDEYVRNTAARAVQFVLLDAPDAVPELVRALEDDRVEVRRHASRLLAWCYDHVAAAREPLLAALAGDEDSIVRANAANSLRLLPPEAAGPALPALATATEDPAPAVRREALTAVAWLGGEETVRLATRLLEDPDASVRERALYALRPIPDLPDSLAGAAAALAKDEAPAVRRRAAFLLGRFPERPEIVVPALLEAMEDESIAVRIAAAVSLGEMVPPDPRIPGALCRALEEGSPDLTRTAAASLAKLGPAAAEAAPALGRALRNAGDPQTRQLVASALGAVLGPLTDEAVDALEVETRRDPDVATLCAAEALLRIRRRDPDRLRLLIDGLRDSRIGPSAAKLLCGLGSLAAPALDSILAISAEEGAAGRRADAVLVMVSAVDAKDALRRLERALATGDPDLRNQVLLLLYSLGPRAAPLVPSMTKALADPNPGIRSAAATALGRVGEAARDALPALEEAAKAPEPVASTMARQAIREIRMALDREGD